MPKTLTTEDIEDIYLEWITPDGEESKVPEEVLKYFRLYGITEKRVINKRTGKEGYKLSVTIPNYRWKEIQKTMEGK